ncbi:MAG TPA: ABC transporter permease subunit [Thermoclostridium sp.]
MTKRKSPLVRIKESWRLYVLLLPAVLYLAIFHYAPIYGLQIAFKDFVPSLGITGSKWVGLKHFKYFISSPQFPILMRNTLLLSVYSLIFTFPLPIILALMLNETRSVVLKKTVQNITYAPHFISTVVLCGMVIIFLSPSSGVINTFLKMLGHEPVDFMTKEQYWRSIYIISGIWKNTGWSSIIYLAALSGVDPQLYDAAHIDGASRLQRIWHINIPGIIPTAVLLFIMNCGQIMSVGFEKVYLLQNSLNLPVSEVISTYVYKTGLLGAKFSYTSAIGLFNSVINVTLLLIVNKISSKVSDIMLF